MQGNGTLPIASFGGAIAPNPQALLVTFPAARAPRDVLAERIRHRRPKYLKLVVIFSSGAARHSRQSAGFDGAVGFDKPATDRLGAMLIDVNEAAGGESLGPSQRG
jgi:hypothetical protein